MRSNLLRLAVAFFFALAATPAFAALFFVETSAVDLSDIDPGDGVCAFATIVPVGQRCTLRAAVAEANALPGADVILIPANMTIVLVNGEIEINSALTLGSLEQGTSRPVVDANHLSRVFKVRYVPSSASVVIGNLVIQGGRALGDIGNNGGGAIETEHGDYELSITGCDFVDNAAGGGGALSTLNSQVEITDSTFTGNFLAASVANVHAWGSAVWIGSGVTTSIERSTFSLNSSLRANTRAALLAATNDLQILNSTIDLNPLGGITSIAPEVLIANSTISNNGAYGVEVTGPESVSFAIRNSIIADNELGCIFDVFGLLATSASYSLDEDDSCGFFPSADNLLGVDPKLGALANNGGPTRTKSPLPGSPALDAGHPAAPGGPGTCLSTDQRGVARPQASIFGGIARCDMGAVEVPEPSGAALAGLAIGALLSVAATRSSAR
jgi:hypothetical protein